MQSALVDGLENMINETWGLVREELVKRIGRNNYVTWIEPLTLRTLDQGVARFEVPTSFFGLGVVQFCRSYSVALEYFWSQC